MLKAALESLKKKDKCTQLTAGSERGKDGEKSGAIKADNNWNSSQLSELLFSSSPPPVSKIAKIEAECENENRNGVKTNEDNDIGMSDVSFENGFDDLLRELDSDEEWNSPIQLGTIDDKILVMKRTSSNDKNINLSPSPSASLNLLADTPNVKDTIIPKNFISNSLAFCSNNRNSKVDEGNETEIVFSAPDSIYNKSPNIKGKMMMPMIDISTPLIQNHTQNFTQKSSCRLSTTQLQSANTLNWMVMLPESFTIETLQLNIHRIDPSLHLNPIAAIKNSSDRRIRFPVAVMVRDFRGMGGMVQVRLVDGSGNEIGGSLPFVACSELNIKLHFGLVLILNEVSVFSPVPGMKYLNITKGNISSFYYNARTINN